MTTSAVFRTEPATLLLNDCLCRTRLGSLGAAPKIVSRSSNALGFVCPGTELPAHPVVLEADTETPHPPRKNEEGVL